MPAERRYFLVRLCAANHSFVPRGESFVLLPETVPAGQHLLQAQEALRLGQQWFASRPNELERLALVLRDYTHHFAAILEEHFPELNVIGLDSLHSAFTAREVRLALASALGPALTASVLAEASHAALQGRERSIDNLWRQMLGQRGATKLFLRTLASMHQRTAAGIIAEHLTLAWRPKFADADTVTEIPVPLEVFHSDPTYLYVMNNLPYHAVREALALRSFASTEDSPWPTAKIKRGATQGQAQLFPVELEMNPYQEPDEQKNLIDRMWSQVSDLNDLDADVLDMLSALWIQQARDPNDFARISVKKLLEMRGLKAKTGAGGRASGFRPEQKQQLFAAIQHISNLYLLIYDLEVPRADNKGRDRREVHSRAFVVTDILGNRTPGSINLDIEEFLIRPGVLFGHFLFGPGRQLALLSSKAIQYDRIRQEWEKRLARYFSWIWRNDATNDRPVRSFLVKTLLEAAGKQVDEQHPKRTRDRLEKALSTLRSDKVIASWEWDRNRTLPFHEPRNWQDYWLDWSVRIEMPQFVQKYYQNISQPGTPGVLASPKTLDLNLGANTASPQPKDLTQKDNLASRLFTWRKEHRHSQAQMAALLGVTQSFYSHLERGSREPSPETRHRIENLLKRPL